MPAHSAPGGPRAHDSRPRRRPISANIGYATLQVLPTTDGFAKALQGATSPAGDAAGKAAGGKFGGGIVGSLAKFAAPLAAAWGTAAIAGALKNVTVGAAELEQSVGAVDTVFKGNAGQMHQWAQAAAQSVGLAENEYNGFAALIGTQLRNAGVPMDELNGKTDGLIRMGADLASMYGGTTAEAVEALSSALKGEMDPIERYGISLNDAALRAKAAAMGLDTSGASLSQATKAAAVMALVQEQGADAVGNFTREANTALGQQQRWQAAWQNITTTIGSAFVPIMTVAYSLLNQYVVPALTNAVAVFADVGARLGEAFSGAGGGIEGLQAMLQEGVNGLTAWVQGGGITGLLNGILALRSQVMSAVLAAVPGIVAAVATILPQIVTGILGMVPTLLTTTTTVIAQLLTGLAAMYPQMTAVWVGLFAQIAAALPGLVTQIATALVTMLPVLLDGAVTLFGALLTAVGQIVPALLGAVLGMVGPIVETVVGMLPALLAAGIEAFTALVEAVLAVLPTLITTVLAMLPPLLDTLIGMLPQLLEAGVQMFTQLVNAVLKVLPEILDTLLGDVLPALLTTLVAMLPQLLSAGIELFLALVEAVLDVLPDLLDTLLGDVLPSVIDTLVGMVPTLIEAGITLFLALVEALLEAAPDIMDTIVTEVIPTIVSTIIDAVPDLIEAGGHLIGGLIDGIVGSAGRLISAIRENITDALPDFVKRALGIHSPSRVFRELGGYVGEGMALGIADGARDVQKAADALVPDTPKIGAFGSPTFATSSAAARSAAVPSTLVVVDADGALVGRMQVEAGRVADGSVTPLTLGRASW